MLSVNNNYNDILLQVSEWTFSRNNNLANIMCILKVYTRESAMCIQ